MIAISAYIPFYNNRLPKNVFIGKNVEDRLKHAVKIMDRIKRSVANCEDGVFLRAEFERFGSSARVSRGSTQLTREGALGRLGVGVYARAKPSVLTGAGRVRSATLFGRFPCTAIARQ